MANFFNPNELSDRNLLHQSVRDHDELMAVTYKIEWEVIEAFRQRDSFASSSDFFAYENGVNPGSKPLVRLVGYDEKNPEESDDHLKEALRRTIANVVSWVLRNYENQSGVSSVSQGKRSISYSGVMPSWDQFPDGWDTYLKNYDARIMLHGI